MNKEYERACINVDKIRIPSVVKHYNIVKTIGKGGFSVVVLGVHQKTGQKVAIKIIDREEVSKQQIFCYLENELRLISRFDHPNIVKVYDIIYEEDIIMVVMEYLECGDLQKLVSQGIFFNCHEQITIALQILSALSYLHKRGIAHRDIKPENILFDKYYNPKLIDFGLSRENCNALKTLCGTTDYLAPEVLRMKEYDGKKADLWSLGIVLHILSSNAFPFDITSEISHINKLQNNTLILNILTPGKLGMVIKSCLEFNQNLRLDCDELIKMLEESRPIFSHETMRETKIVGSKSGLPQLLTRNNTPILVPRAKQHEIMQLGMGRKRRHFSSSL
ncbi:CAMK family protein kinase [Trichomonas vaginalis G3]|uniref:CAMK family protein kinase n=1 Tax=Trichomonas vaginalis (strain ATCC PRA-98 / G3) TaxID=412133 RepID=A2EB76_TRIV3|nr:protein serine/threonine kinase protein [Trichomonas vaginalis G3]EAY10122.1 CAMK family protein kinase [Trichomonas vaginalis G3]KAI5531504.1 protein serine/threonine kinase protein [Trichomonas vaginalis G3]|eukprot:XP_001322345.1 CAMK family protein kinase [Trichomonas vaginalis G3]